MLGMISPRISKVFKLKAFSPEATDIYSSAFKQVVEYREANGVDRNDVAQTLMNARRELVLNEDFASEDEEYYAVGTGNKYQCLS